MYVCVSRWTIIAHHTGHGGYNRADKSRFFNSRGFAQGSLLKRATQWCVQYKWLPVGRYASWVTWVGWMDGL
jgi:hypothetical protein